MLRDYYETARENFAAKMKTEDDERSNLKFKIASFVIYEVTHSTPAWFKNHFLTTIAKNDNPPDKISEKIQKAENAFYEAVADYLLKLETEVDYVKKIMVPFIEERDKKEFWEAIVFDAFLIAGIYFTPSLEPSGNGNHKIRSKQIISNGSPGYSCHASIPTAAETNYF